MISCSKMCVLCMFLCLLGSWHGRIFFRVGLFWIKTTTRKIGYTCLMLLILFWQLSCKLTTQLSKQDQYHYPIYLNSIHNQGHFQHTWHILGSQKMPVLHICCLSCSVILNQLKTISGNVHRAYRREVPKNGVLPTVRGWAGLCFLLSCSHEVAMHPHLYRSNQISCPRGCYTKRDSGIFR